MEAKAPLSPPKRRTQAERRATTRAALLDATIDCLIEDGYTHTTTTKIVERAGVSRGAQVHHFPTKAELVAQAVRHLAQRRAAEMEEEMAKILKLKTGRVEASLDLLWDLYRGSLYAASVELFVAARTDEELRGHLLEVEREINREIATLTKEFFPAEADVAALLECLEVALATMRGLALLEFTDPKAGQRRWPRVKRRLVSMFEAAGADL